MVDREHPARREEQRQKVLRLLDAAGIRLSNSDVARREVSASVSVFSAVLGARAKGNVLVTRRPLYDDVDMWHANMGDRDCLDLADLVEMTLRGLGYVTQRGTAVPNQVDFVCPATSAATSFAITE